MNVLQIISIVSLLAGIVSAAVIAIDIIAGRKQKMVVMNFVYPISGLYGGIFALLFYFTRGRVTSPGMTSVHSSEKDAKNNVRPLWESVAIGTLHCGSGCTLGDMLAELFLLYFPITILGSSLAGKWTVDYVFAFLTGIVFQYFAIKPMKNLRPAEALKAALKADALSLTAWQAGMYGWMAVAVFLIFKQDLKPSEPLFWFMMQIAMILGFITAYPMNRWLIQKGIKERM